MAEHGLRKVIITITVITAAVIELIDTSIVNVALNDMSGNLGSTLEDVAWVVTAYAIANVIIIPMTSFLAARFGRRNYYISSILLFTASSVACGNAHNIWELVAFRFIQGIGGGALLSTSSAGSPRRSSGSASLSGRRSGRRSAGGSSTSTPGPGSSTSTCRSASRRRSFPGST